MTVNLEISRAFNQVEAKILVVAYLLDQGGNVVIVNLEPVGPEVNMAHLEKVGVEFLPFDVRRFLLLVLVGNGEAGVDETDVVNSQDEVFGILFGLGNFLGPCGNVDDGISFVGDQGHIGLCGGDTEK